jgi:hypothetical protein
MAGPNSSSKNRNEYRFDVTPKRTEEGDPYLAIGTGSTAVADEADGDPYLAIGKLAEAKKSQSAEPAHKYTPRQDDGLSFSEFMRASGKGIAEAYTPDLGAIQKFYDEQIAPDVGRVGKAGAEAFAPIAQLERGTIASARMGGKQLGSLNDIMSIVQASGDIEQDEAIPELVRQEREKDPMPKREDFAKFQDRAEEIYNYNYAHWQERDKERENKLRVAASRSRYNEKRIPELAGAVAQRMAEANALSTEQAPGKIAFDKAKGIVDSLAAVGRDPVSVIAGLAAESLPVSIPSLVGGAAGSIAGPVGTAAGAGMGSLMVEQASTIMDELQKEGADFADDDSVMAVVSDPERMARIRDKALRRGVPIALMDSFSAGLAGRTLRGAKTTRQKVTKGAAELGMQMGLGGGGEALAGAIEGEINWKDVLAEALGEVGSGAGEIVTGAVRDSLRAPKMVPMAPESKTVPMTPPAPADVTQGPGKAPAGDATVEAYGSTWARKDGAWYDPEGKRAGPVREAALNRRYTEDESPPETNTNSATTEPTTGLAPSREEIGDRPGWEPIEEAPKAFEGRDYSRVVDFESREAAQDYIDEQARREGFSDYDVEIFRRPMRDGKGALYDVRYEKRGRVIKETVKGATPNRHGVFEEPDEEIKFAAPKAMRARISLAELKSGHWIVAEGYDYLTGQMGGYGGGLSANQTYKTRDEALDAATGTLLRLAYVTQKRAGHPEISDKQVAAYTKMVAWANELRANAKLPDDNNGEWGEYGPELRSKPVKELAKQVAKLGFENPNNEYLVAPAPEGEGHSIFVRQRVDEIEKVKRQLEEKLKAKKLLPQEEEQQVEPQSQLGGKAAAVQPISADQLALKPDLMQFKRIDESDTGENEADKITGQWDSLKGGNLLLWEPARPEEHGLAPGEKYVVANGHHRVAFGKRQGIQAFNAQIVREIDGYTAQDARRLAAEINIADGKGTIYDQAKYIRNVAATHGADEALAAGRRVGARGRQAADIAILAADSAFDAFVNEQIKPDAAQAIALAAPGNDTLQRLGVSESLQGSSPDQVSNFLKAAQVATTQPGSSQTEQLDLFAADDSAITLARARALQAEAIQKRLTDDIRAIQGAGKNPEAAKKYGIDIADPEALQKSLLELKRWRDAWSNWHTSPEMVAKIDQLVSGENIDIAVPEPAAAPSDVLPGTDTFNLASEEQTDPESAIDKAEREKQAKAEKDKQEKDQTKLFDEPAKTFTLPKELAGAKPRYAYGEKQFELIFESDLDKAVYILAQTTPSKRDKDYLTLVMTKAGMTEDEARAAGGMVRDQIKLMAKESDAGGTLRVPAITDMPRAKDKTVAKLQAERDALLQKLQGPMSVPARHGLTKKIKEVEAMLKSLGVDVNAGAAVPDHMKAADKGREESRFRGIYQRLMRAAKHEKAGVAAEFTPEEAKRALAELLAAPGHDDAAKEALENRAQPSKPERLFEDQMSAEDLAELAKLEAEMKKKLGQVNTGFDPELFGIGSRIAIIYIKAGAKTFSAFSKAMIGKFGEDAKQYLLSWYEHARLSGKVDAATMDGEGEALRVYEREILGNTDAPGRDVPAVGGAGAGKRTPVARVVRKELIPKPEPFVGADSFSSHAGFRLDADQILGANTALTRFKRKPDGASFLLGDGTGFGKTAQILAVIAKYREQNPGARVLYVTQNRQMLAGTWTRDSQAMGVDLKDVVATTYDGLKKATLDGKRDYDLAIFDEAHNLKNATSQKSMAQARVRAKHKMFATATPMDRPTGAAYFLAEITGEDEAAVAAKLGYELQEREDPATREIYTIPVLLGGHNWGTVWTNIMKYRDASIRDGGMLRREYPFYGTVEEVETVWVGNDAKIAEDIAKHYNDLIEKPGQSAMARRNFAGQRTLTLRRWSEQSKVRTAFDETMAHVKAGGQAIIMVETNKEQSFPVPIPGARQDVNLKGNPVWKVDGAGTRLNQLFAEAGVSVAQINDTKKNVVSVQVDKFQIGECAVAIATPASGGAGINLDDTVGDKPRLLIGLSPTLAGDLFDQILGRVSRKTTQSEAKVRLYFNPQSEADQRSKDIQDRKVRTLRAIQGGGDLDRESGFDPDAKDEDSVGSPRRAGASGRVMREVDPIEDEEGSPAVAGLPPIPPHTVPGSHPGPMSVSMERMAPGSKIIDIPTVMASLERVMATLGANVPFRTGRFNTRKYLGIFKIHSAVIRLKSADSIPTAAHEVAHAMSKWIFGDTKSRSLIAAMKHGTPSSKAAIKELRALGHALYGSTVPNAGYVAEGFSELVRLWLTTEDAHKAAPHATVWFENTILGKGAPIAPGAATPVHRAAAASPVPGAGNPELREAMLDSRAKIDLWRGEGYEDRVRAQEKPTPGMAKRIASFFKEQAKPSELYERFDPLAQLANNFEETTGKRLKTDKNPYLVASSLRNTAGSILQRWVEHGMTNFNGNSVGPSLKEALAIVRPNQSQQFWHYLWARYAIERWKEGKNPGMTVEDAAYLKNKMERDFPEFVVAADKYYNWMQGVRNYLREASPEMNGVILDAIEANPSSWFYVPLQRELPPKGAKLSEQIAHAFTGDAPSGGGLFRMHGSGLPVKDIRNQLMLNVERLISRAHRDRVFDTIIQVSQYENMGWMIEEVPRSKVIHKFSVEHIRSQLEKFGVDTKTIPDDALLSYVSHEDTPKGYAPILARKTERWVMTPTGRKRKSEIRWYQVDPDLYDMLIDVETPGRLGPAFELIFAGPARMFKLGTTGLRPSFGLVTNVLRDFPAAVIQSISGGGWQFAGAYFAAIRDMILSALPRAVARFPGLKNAGQESETLAMYRQLGVSGSTFVGGDIMQARRMARTLHRGKVLTRLSTPVETLREMLSFMEAAPRMAELSNTAKEYGWTPGSPLNFEQAVAMRLAAKRVTVDFAAAGRTGAAINRAIPFYNATIQGIRSFGRSFKDEKGIKKMDNAVARTLLRATMLLTLPALSNWMRNRDKEWYKALPWRERWLYLNIEAGDQVLQIPLPQEFGASFASMPVALLESMYYGDTKYIKSASDHMARMFNPMDWPVIPKMLWEQGRNTVEFFGSPIVPRQELDLLPGAQRSEHSSWFAQKLGDIYPEHVSPRRVDAALRELFGGVGRDVADAPNTFMRMLGLKTASNREWEPADIPVLGRVARRGGEFSSQSAPLVDFWDDYHRYTSLSETQKNAQRNDKPNLRPVTDEEQAYAAVLRAHYPEIRFYLGMAKIEPNADKRRELYKVATDRAANIIHGRPKETNKPAPPSGPIQMSIPQLPAPPKAIPAPQLSLPTAPQKPLSQFQEGQIYRDPATGARKRYTAGQFV